MNGYDAVCEAIGEFKDIDEFMLKDQRITKRFLFWSWKVVENKGLSSAKLFKEDTALCRKKFKNLNVMIYAIPNKQINCSTIPGYFGDMSQEGLMKPIHKLELHKDYRALKEFNFAGVKPGPNKTVIFPPNKLKTISIFPTYGLLHLLKPEMRLAIYLHEIGHWSYLAGMIPRQILMNDEEFSQTAVDPNNDMRIPFYNIQLLQRAMSIGFKRWNEYESDLYAVRAGYAKELKESFDIMNMGPPKDAVDAYTFLQNEKFRKYNEWKNKLKSRLNIGHPSDQHRKDQIDYATKNKGYLK